MAPLIIALAAIAVVIACGAAAYTVRNAEPGAAGGPRPRRKAFDRWLRTHQPGTLR